MQQEVLIRATQNVLHQLEHALRDISNEIYCKPVPTLSGSSIGQHVRHLLEFYQELQRGYPMGEIDYAKRKRDVVLETDVATASNLIFRLFETLMQPDKPIILVVDYTAFGGDLSNVHTSFDRELVFNLEHAIHHMALIRIGIHALTSLVLPDHFGVAASTISYRNQVSCAP